MKLEIVKKFESIDLMLIKMFGYSKMPEVLIIGDYFDKVFYSLEFQLLFFKRFNNHQKLFIINLIIVFGRNIFGRKTDNKMESSYRIILKEYISRNLIRNIGFKDYSPIKIEKGENKGDNKDRL